MRQVILAVLRSGFRGRAFQVVFLLGLLMMVTAFLASQFSPRQPKTVALDVGLSGLRIAMVLLGLSWVQEYLGKELERKTVYLSLTYPVPRFYFIAGRFLGILLLLAIAGLCLAMLLWLVVLNSGAGYQQEFLVSLGAAYWTAIFGVWLDVAVVTAFALVVTSVSTVPVLPLAVGAAFAVAGKAIGPMVDYVRSGEDTSVAAMGPLLEMIKWVLPDLSRLDWRIFPMYDLPLVWPDLALSTAMALSYIGILISLAGLAFARREFS